MDNLKRLLKDKLKIHDTTLKISQETITELVKCSESTASPPIPGSGFFEWLEKEVPEVENRIFALSYLTSVLESSTGNLILVAASPFAKGILAHLPSIKNSVYFESMVKLLEGVSKFSMAEDDICLLFSYITGKTPIYPGNSTIQTKRQRMLYQSLINTLGQCPGLAPTSFFWFPGGNSVIEVESDTVFDTKWPTNHTWMFWIYLEDILPSDAQSKQQGNLPYEPRILNFITASTTGLEVFLKGEKMYVRTGNGPCASFDCKFELRKWYFVVLHQTQSKDIIFKTPLLSAYINGALIYQTSSVRLPSVTGILSQRTIGNVSQKCASPARKVSETGFRGRISLVASGHSGQLSLEQIAHLYSLGPGFVPTTHYLSKKLRCPLILDFVFAPRSVCGGDSGTTVASVDRGSKGLSLTSALLNLGTGPAPTKPPLRAHLSLGARAVVCQPPRSGLYAAVGVETLLLLFHPHVLGRWPATALAMAADTLRLAIAGQTRAHYDFQRAGGAGLIARLLRAAPKEALTPAAVRPFANLGALLTGFAETRAEAYMPYIFNFECWRRAGTETQRELSEVALSLVSSDPKYFREFLGLDKTIRGLKIYSRTCVKAKKDPKNENKKENGVTPDTPDVQKEKRNETNSEVNKEHSNENENSSEPKQEEINNESEIEKKEEIKTDNSNTTEIPDDDESSTSLEDIEVIRRIFCSMIEIQLKEAGDGLRGDELRPLVRYLRHSPEEDVYDVVYLLIRMMKATARNVYVLLSENSEGYSLFMRLLGSGTKAMRILGLQLCGLFLRGLTACADGRRGSATAGFGALIQDFPFEAIKDHLSRHTLDYETYLYLVQFFMLDYRNNEAASPASPSLFTSLKALASYTAFPKPFPASQCVLDIIEDLIGNELGRISSAQGPDASVLGDCFRMIEDLTFSIEMNQALQALIVTHKFWHKPFILLLLHVSNLSGSGAVTAAAAGKEKEKEEEEDKQQQQQRGKEIQLSLDHIFIAVSLLLKAACTQEGGWRQIEELLLYTSITWPPKESARVSLRILYQLMGYIAPYAKHARQSASIVTLWTNFANLACMIEAIVFKPPSELPSAEGAEAHRGTGCAALYYDENGEWRDSVLLLKFFQVFDALWASEYVRNLPPVSMESINGRKRNLYVVLLRLALAILQELQNYFREGGPGAAAEKDKAKSCFEFYAQTSKRVINILNSMSQVSSKSIVGRTPKDLGATAIWVIYSILHAMARISEPRSEENRALFIVARNVAITTKPHIEAFLTTLQQQQQDGEKGGGDAGQPQPQAGTGPGAGASTVAKEGTVWSYLLGNKDANSFIEEWFIPHFKSGGEGSKVVMDWEEEEELVAAFERRQFAETAVAAEPRREAALISLREEISKSSTERRLVFQRELNKCEARLAEEEDEECRLEAFTAASAAQEARHKMKAVVRADTSPRGCWSYRDGRQMYPQKRRTGGDEYVWGIEEEEEEEDAEDENNGNTSGDIREKPFWKLDQTLWSEYMTRPLLKMDFTVDFGPRMDAPKKLKGDDEGGSGRASMDSGEREGEGEAKLAGSGQGEEWVVVEQGSADDLPNVGEKYSAVAPCSRVALFEKAPGVLCITGSALYFFRRGDATGARGFKRWALGALRRVHVRRLGVAWALEVYARRGYLFEMGGQKAAADFARRLVAAAGKQLRCIDNPARTFRKEDWTGLWQSGALSNFQYLMLLNMYSGRTFNDLAQYPVFPWVLADYASAGVDLRAPAAFRDLAKPVGALNPSRLEGFLARFHEMQADAQGSPIPPFLYGSHYSTLGAITFWLTRLEPFSHVARDLQGGCFDHADRLFFSVDTAWTNCLLSTSDVKELVPEFFYLSDFLRNVNGYRLGRLQAGAVVDDVVLPPWAAGSPELFVRFNAEALESEYVSAHLHEWIDLIFGYKQRGQAAIDANNLFYYLTYPDSIDAAAAEGDSLEATALRTQLAYFGQCPTQLFTTPHPQRTCALPPKQDQKGGAVIPPTSTQPQPQPQPSITISPPSPRPSSEPINNGGGEVTTLGTSGRAGQQQQPPSPVQGLDVSMTNIEGSEGSEIRKGSLLGLAEESVAPEIISSSGAIPSASCNVGDRIVILGRDFCFNVLVPGALRAGRQQQRATGNEGKYTLQYWGAGPVCAHPAYPHHLVATTLHRTGFLVGSVGARGSVLQAVNTHCAEAVTCLALNPAGTVLAVGGSNGLAELWGVRQTLSISGGPGSGTSGHTPQVSEDEPPALLRGQTRPLTCVAFTRSSAVCATGAADGAVCIHSIGDRDGQRQPALVAAIPGEGGSAAVVALAFTQQDDLVVLRRGAPAVEVYTLNGRLVERIEVGCKTPLVDMFVVPGAEGREAIVAIDTRGFTLISTALGRMPHPRERFRWTLPDTFPYNTYNIDKGFRWTGQMPQEQEQRADHSQQQQQAKTGGAAYRSRGAERRGQQTHGAQRRTPSPTTPASLRRSGPLAGAQQIISSLPLGGGSSQAQWDGVAFVLQCTLKGAKFSTFKQCDASSLYVMISIKYV